MNMVEGFWELFKKLDIYFKSKLWTNISQENFYNKCYKTVNENVWDTGKRQ